jgi:tetratricopeptide (TPR) repeat protein
MNAVLTQLRTALLALWSGLSAMEKLTVIGVITAALVTAGWTVYTYQPPEKPLEVINLITEGDNFLDIGDYDQAQQSFAEALKINSQDEAAVWGLDKTKLWADWGTQQNEQVFWTKLHSLQTQDPNDAHVNLFLGKWYAAHHDNAQALGYYKTAIDSRPALAEAWFARAVLYQQQGQNTEAEQDYRQAITLQPLAKYQTNLAGFYAAHGKEPEAITLYESISNFPLAEVELAPLYWRHQHLAEASTALRQALQLLADTPLMAQSAHQDPWYFVNTTDDGIELFSLAEKTAYTRYCLVVSLFLQNQDKAARQELAKQEKLAQEDTLKAIINADLQRLQETNPAYQNPIRRIRGALKIKASL